MTKVKSFSERMEEAAYSASDPVLRWMRYKKVVRELARDIDWLAAFKARDEEAAGLLRHISDIEDVQELRSLGALELRFLGAPVHRSSGAPVPRSLEALETYLPKSQHGEGILAREDIIRPHETTDGYVSHLAMLYWKLRSGEEQKEAERHWFSKLYPEAQEIARSVLSEAGLDYEAPQPYFRRDENEDWRPVPIEEHKEYEAKQIAAYEAWEAGEIRTAWVQCPWEHLLSARAYVAQYRHPTDVLSLALSISDRVEDAEEATYQLRTNKSLKTFKQLSKAERREISTELASHSYIIGEAAGFLKMRLAHEGAFAKGAEITARAERRQKLGVARNRSKAERKRSILLGLAFDDPASAVQFLSEASDHDRAVLLMARARQYDKRQPRPIFIHGKTPHGIRYYEGIVSDWRGAGVFTAQAEGLKVAPTVVGAHE